MKNKGFTLIELLAVIVILAIIALIAVPIVINIINDARESGYKRSIDAYGKSIEQGIATYQIKYPNESILQIGVKTEDLESTEGLDINYEGSRVVCSNISVYKDGTIYLSGCSVGGHQVDYTYGTQKLVCTKVDGASKEVGSKYRCTVMNNVYFYVLENNELSENISLIMDRNFTDGDGTNGTIPPTVAWCTDGGSNSTTCKNINTTGEDAPEGKDYIGHIKEVFNTREVTVSFPTPNQVDDSNDTNNFLYDYLDHSFWGGGTQPTNHIPDIFGYWLATAKPNSTIYGVYVHSSGEILNYAHVDSDSNLGIRPVITISKNLLD